MLQIKESFNLGSCLDLLAPGGGRLGVESGEEVKKWGQEGHSQHRFIMLLLLLLFQAYAFLLVVKASTSLAVKEFLLQNNSRIIWRDIKPNQSHLDGWSHFLDQSPKIQI